MAVSLPATIEFSGAQSSDPDGQIVDYEWSFSDGQTRSGQTVTRDFDLNDNGQITATLTVTDNRGGSDSDQANVILVRPENVAPNARISPNSKEVTVPDTVTFDASDSDAGNDPYPGGLDYEWSLDGTVTGGGGPTLAVEFDNPGSYQVEVTVTDSQGATDTATASVVAELPPNEPPNAVATANPTSGQTPLDVRFDGGQSTDPDGTIQEYEWDFSDGVTESGEVVTRTFTDDAPSSVVCTLTVTDSQGVTRSDSVTVELTDSGIIGGVDDETVAQAAIVGASISSTVLFD